MDIALYLLAAALIIGGLIGSVIPALPALTMIFGGIWLAAAVDDYHHVGLWWLLILGGLGAAGVVLEFIASTLGAKRIGASRQALWGASIGMLAGMFFGIPGLLLPKRAALGARRGGHLGRPAVRCAHEAGDFVRHGRPVCAGLVAGVRPRDLRHMAAPR
jgi:uncharacterized protein YqgC (DUF456 family)